MVAQREKSDLPLATKGQDRKKPGTRKRISRAHTARRVLQLFRPYKWKVVLIILATLVSTALNLVVPALIPSVIDNALSHRNIGLLVIYALIMISAVVVSGIVGIGQAYLNNLVGQRVMRDLRNTLYAHLQNLSLRFFTSVHTGDIQSRLSNDISSAQSAVTDTFTILITSLIVVAGTTAVMLYLNPLLALVLFLFLPLFLVPALKVGSIQRNSVRATQQSLAALTALMQETLSVSGILLIKTFGRKQYAQSQFEAKNQKLMDASVYQQMLGRMFGTFLNTFMTLVPVVLYVLTGILIVYLPNFTHITAGILFAFVIIQDQFFGPANQLSTALMSTQGSLALFDRIFEYLDQEIEIADVPNAVHLSSTEIHGKVDFKSVSFNYQRYVSPDFPIAENKLEEDSAQEEPLSREILQDLSFTVQPGQLVALVGPSGAGKTTITYLISRLYDVTGGAIELDGLDIRDIALDSLQNLIGSVTQETYLFHASVRDNLLYVRPEATDEEMIAATKAAAIHERIMELDDGYDTTVGERGYKLSGGEKQRIAIARVLLKNPRVLILDEATSSLDTTSERLIQHALEPLMKGRTTIAIAHRLSTVLAADLILVLDKGEIVERGTHQELLEHGGLYAKLYNQQFAYQI